MEQIQREIQSLTDRLNALKSTGKSRRRPKRQPAVQSGASQSTVTAVASGSGNGARRSRRKRKKGVAQVSNNIGVITLARKELLAPIVIAKGQPSGLYGWAIVPASFNFLKQFSMFDKVRWNKLHLFYKPGVGATTNGMVSYGIQWDFSHLEPTNRTSISSLTPNMTHSVWQDGSATPLVCPPSRLQSKPWFTPGDSEDKMEKGPGMIMLAVTKPEVNQTMDFTVGELWADYSVTMTGTGFS